MTQAEEAQLVAIRAQAIAIASAAEALLGMANQCCANPKLTSEDTYAGKVQRCMNCGAKSAPLKEGS